MHVIFWSPTYTRARTTLDALAQLTSRRLEASHQRNPRFLVAVCHNGDQVSAQPHRVRTARHFQ